MSWPHVPKKDCALVNEVVSKANAPCATSATAGAYYMLKELREKGLVKWK